MILRVVALALGALLTAGCLDLSDAPYAAHVVSFDAGPVGDAVAGDALAASPCNQCVFPEGAPCRSAFDECAKSPKCKALVECAGRLGCLAFADYGKLVPCSQPCLSAAGITSNLDPAAQAAAPVFFCSKDTSKCGDACNQ